MIDYCYEEKKMIGGKDHVVQIDEDHFGRRKYDRGRIIRGRWIFVGIEMAIKKLFSGEILLEMLKIEPTKLC